MKKEFGVIFILGLLVLSLSFSSAGWFSDTWNTITGKVITGNVINDIGNGLMLYSSFEGNANDISGNGYDGAIVGANCSAAGIRGSACIFDGNDYIDYGSLNPANLDAYSVSVWFNNDPTGVCQAYGCKILGKTIFYHDWDLNLGKIGGGVSLSNYEGGAGGGIGESTGLNYRDNKWHQVIVIKDGTSGFIYIDGVLAGNSTNMKKVVTNGNFYVGLVPSTDMYQRGYWKGKIDELRVYNRALSGNEIRELYSLGSANTTVPACTSFTYSDWSTCSNGAQTRTILSSSPTGCAGGNPILNQSCVVAPTCTDSDGGLNYYVKGSTTFNRLGSGPESTYSDRCMIYGRDASTSNYSCLGINCQIDEYGCNSEKNLIVSTYNCSGGCSNGACLNVTTPNLTCTDSDGGLNYYTFGNITSGDLASGVGIREDTCLNNSLREMFCTNNLGTPQLYDCPNGCSNGACVNTSIPVEPTPSCAENYKIRANNFANEAGIDRVTIELYKDESWQSSCIEREVGDTCTIGDIEIIIANISRLTKEVYLEVNTPSVFDYKYVKYPLKQYLVINSTSAPFSLYNDNYIVVSYCGSSYVCQAEVNQIKNPTDLTIEGVNWSLQYNYSDDYDSESYSYASWRMNKEDQYNYVWVSVLELSNKDSVKQRLDDALENGLCQVSRVYSSYENEEYKNVYTCRNIWRIAQQNQQVSSGSAWNYQNDVVVLWFNDNLLFNMEFSSNNYNNCYDSESCQRIENENHQRQQTDLIDTIDKLINNKNEYTSSGYLDYGSEQFVKHFLIGCGSEVKDLGFEGSWYCRIDPAVCPPHGEQTQICTRWNQITGKDEKRETPASCNPGICSGCMTPKWFGSAWDSKCIGYGFRFASEVQPKVVSINYIDQDSVIIKIGGSIGEVTPSLSNGEKYSLSDGTLLRVNQIHYSTKENVSSYVDISLDNYGMWIKEGGSVNMPSTINAYCDIDGEIKEQKVSNSDGSWSNCQNSYECFSNVCSNGECVDTAALANELTGFRGFIVKMLCRLSNPFSDSGYSQCLSDNQ